LRPIIFHPKTHHETHPRGPERASHDNKAKLVYSNFWEHYPQRRSLLFLFDGHHVSDPVIFSSFDVDTPPKAAAAP
jgi:hypothetical protein